MATATSDSFCTSRENHEWLIERYARLLESQGPATVLDVGCGSGILLRACRERGMEATGLDAPGPRLTELEEAGFDVSEGSAYELPFEDRSVDWVSLRHVPHHLEHPSRAFAELLRVARTGVILAEPFFDVSVPSQAGATALDIWEKRQHRRGGMIHDEVYNLGALLEMMPSDFDANFQVETHTTLRLRSRDVDMFHTEARELVADVDPGDAECDALESLISGLKQTGLSWNGSLVLVLTRRVE